MGSPENVFKLHDTQATQLPDGLAIVAGRDHIDHLALDLESSALIKAILLSQGVDEEVPAEILANLKALVLEIDPAQAVSIKRLDAIRKARPNLPIIAAIAKSGQADLDVVHKLVRLGVRDVVKLPFSAAELTSRLLDVLIGSEGDGPPAERGTMLAFQRSVGGDGATTVLTHTALLLAQQQPGKHICVVDLDVQTGAVAPYLGVDAQVDLGSLLDAGQRMDADLIAATLIESEHGFKVLAAPKAIRPLDSVEINQVLRMLDLLRERFDYVLVDLPSAWSNWSLSLAMASSRVILVCGTTIGSLRQARRKIDLLTEVGLPREKIGIVGNKLERRLFKTIGAAEIETALDCAVLASLGFDGNELTAAQDIGQPVSEINRRSKFLADLGKLVAQIPAMAAAQ